MSTESSLVSSTTTPSSSNTSIPESPWSSMTSGTETTLSTTTSLPTPYNTTNDTTSTTITSSYYISSTLLPSVNATNVSLYSTVSSSSATPTNTGKPLSVDSNKIMALGGAIGGTVALVILAVILRIALRRDKDAKQISSDSVAENAGVVNLGVSGSSPPSPIAGFNSAGGQGLAMMNRSSVVSISFPSTVDNPNLHKSLKKMAVISKDSHCEVSLCEVIDQALVATWKANKCMARIFSSSNQEQMAEFRKEAAILAAATKIENVVNFLGCSSSKPLMIAMEADNVMLLSAIIRQPLPSQVIVGAAMDIAFGLDELHALGVVHLNISPSSILVREIVRQDGTKVLRMVLTDFGLAIHMHGTITKNPYKDRPKFNASGLNYHYCPPESFWFSLNDSKEPLHLASLAKIDIFSFGMTLFELMTKIKPWNGKDQECVRQALCERQERPMWNNFFPSTDKDLKLMEVTEQCWQQDPSKRPDAATLLTSLQDL